MLVSIQDLRSIQEQCDVGELVQRLDVSIDRLTVLWDTDTGSLRHIFKNLKQAISTRVDSFEKTFIYKGSLPIKNFFSKRILNVGASYINEVKRSERESQEKNSENEGNNEKNVENNETDSIKKTTEKQENKADKSENKNFEKSSATEENTDNKTV